VLQLLVTANVVPSSLILSIQLVFLRSMLQLLVTANVVPSSLILSIQLVFLRSVLLLLVTANAVPSSLTMEAILSSKTSVSQMTSHHSRLHSSRLRSDCCYVVKEIMGK
jgi:hypothetical protein